MATGYSACVANVIEPENIQKLCPKEYQAFLDALAKHGDDALHDFAVAVGQEQDCPEGMEDVWDAYQELCKAFEKETKLGLEICYHDSDNNGDCYDAVNGVFWDVQGMYQMTEAGKAFSHLVKPARYVHLG